MSENLEKTYNPKAIEAKLYEKWCDNKYFHAEVDRSKKPFTTVMLPPELAEYYRNGMIDPANKDDLLLLSTRLLINMEEFEGVKTGDIADAGYSDPL